MGAPVTTTNAGDLIFAYNTPGNSINSVNTPYGNFLNNPTNGDASADYIPGTTVSASHATWIDAGTNSAFGTCVAAFLPAASGGGASVGGLNWNKDGLSGP